LDSYTFLVQKDQQSLHEHLQENLKELAFLSSPPVETLIRQGSVWLNGLREKDPFKPCFKQDKVQFWLPQYPIIPFNYSPGLIAYEDSDLMLAWKPPKLNACPSVYSDEDCLSHAIQEYLNASGLEHSLHVINRLDRDTEGLQFFGKNSWAEKKLHAMFEQRLVHKFYYLAVPELSEPKKHYYFDELQEHRGKNRRAVCTFHYLGRKKPSENSPLNLDYFLACPQTGRPHQIRKHCALHLHPIFADPVYGQAVEDQTMFLRCIAYRYLHPDGRWRFFRQDQALINNEGKNVF